MADAEIQAVKAEAAAAPKKVEKVAEKITETVAAAPKAAEKVTEKVAEKVAETVKNTTEAATARLKDIQAQVKTGLEKAGETAKAALTAQRSAVETVVKAGQIYGEGLQGLATHAADVNRVQFEDTMAYLRALTSVKSVKEAVELQSKFARATASRVLTETSAFVEDYLKVAQGALTPVTTKAREAAEKVKQGA